MHKLIYALLAVVLVASACSSTIEVSAPGGTPDPTTGTVDLDPGDIRLLSRLVPFDGCDPLLDHLRTEAGERVGPYGLDFYGGGWGFPVGEGAFPALDATAEETASNDGATAPAAPEGDFGGAITADEAESLVGTNIQELGVDEPDIIKSDGDRILIVSENVLIYVDISGPQAVVTDRIRISDGWGHELFFDGDRALLFTNDGNWGYGIDVDFAEGDAVASTIAEAPPAEEVEADVVQDLPAPLEDPPRGGTELAPEPLPPIDPKPLPPIDPAPFPVPEPAWFGPTAAIIEIDLTDPTNLEIEATLRIQGSYLSARRVGETVRLALTSPPTQLEWVYPSSPAGEDRAERINRELVQETTIEDWIPEYSLTDPNGTRTGQLLACDRLHKPAEFSGFDIVSVLSFGLSEGLTPGDGTGVLASGQQVYASTDRFYVATNQWASGEIIAGDGIAEWNESYTTDIHAFEISTDAPATYIASGSVGGSLLNQFSMDSYDGYFRILTTDGSPWGRSGDTSQTQLTVFSEQGDVLTQVGQVGGLGKGETLYSARLMDEIGFAVTFRQVDPFYVLDLSDPTNPRVTGELKIPGFSSYLHPVADHLILGVGQDATDTGQTTGLKVSLFDVSDVTNPVEVDTWVMPNAQSDVQWNHKSFQFLPEQGIAVVPFNDWNSGRNGAVLLHIGADSIDEVGRISHLDPGTAPTSDCRELTQSELPQDTELWFIAQDGRVQFCESDDQGGYGSFSCDPIPLDQIEGWFGGSTDIEPLIAELTGGVAGPEDRIEMCWPDGGNYQKQIQRTILVGDTLWTMSFDQLQANRLDGLTVKDIIVL